MTKTNCPICGNNRYTTLKAVKNYDLARCQNCGVLWDARPPSAKKQFEEDYFISKDIKDGYTNYTEGMKVNRLTFTERLKRIIKKTGKTGKLLDVGCALGDCLIEAKNLGWKNPCGIDPSYYACKISKKRAVNVKKGTLRNVDLKPNYFDIILYQDVIEHINDPLEELSIIHRILKPGGWLFIVTPDIDSWWAKILRSRWYHYRPGDHVIYFSRKSLVTVLKRANFTNLETGKTYHTMSLAYILTRLRFYSLPLFGLILKLVQKSSLKDFPIRMSTGEIEAWAQKPKS